MKYFTQTSRADLAVLLFNTEDEPTKTMYADLLGFESIAVEAPVESSFLPFEPGWRSEFHQETTTSAPPSGAESLPGLVHYHILRGEFFNVDENESIPEWYLKAREMLLTYNEVMERYASRVPIELLPLMPWSRVWPVLKHSVSRRTFTGAVDVKKLSREIARFNCLRVVPRCMKRRWPLSIHLLVDRSERLRPFFGDMDMLAEQLKRLCGKHRFRKIELPMGGGAGAFYDDVDEFCDYNPVGEDIAVIALSDFGFLDGECNGETAEYWEALGGRIRLAGNSALALLPCPPGRWRLRITSYWDTIYWDIGRNAIVNGAGKGVAWCNAGDSPAKVSHPEGNPFLLLMSMIMRPDPQLLRHIRALLPIEQTDVGLESDFWSGKYECRSLQPFFQKKVPLEVRIGLLKLLKKYHSAFIDIYAEECLNMRIHDRDLAEMIDSDEINTFIARYAATLENKKWRTTGLDDEFAERFGRIEKRIVSEAWGDIHCAVAWVMKHRTEDLKLDTEAIPENLELESVRWALLKQEQKNYSLRQDGHSLIIDAAGPTISPVGILGYIATNTGFVWLCEKMQRSGMVKRQLLLESVDKVPKLLGTLSGSVFVETPYAKLTIEPISLPPWAEEIGRDRYGLYVDIKVKGVRQRMRWINPGRFMMGSPEGEEGRYENEKQHEVILTDGYWLFDTPVTQALWEAVMGKNPSRFQSSDRPVEMVSWEDCKEFIDRINELVPELKLQLPAEAQWEYACRAGSGAATYAGDLKILGECNAPILDEIAWYSGNSGVDFELKNGADSSGWSDKQYDHKKAGTHPVAKKKPNGWGLYDMIGNVWEWCNDWYEKECPAGTATNPQGPEKGEFRVLRGGSWNDYARNCRSVYRDFYGPGNRFVNFGFRLSRGQEQEEQEVVRDGQPEGSARTELYRSEGGQAQRPDAPEVRVPEILTYKWHSEHGRDTSGIWLEFAYKEAVQRMRWIEPGNFMMGSPAGEAERLDRELQHDVTLTKGYWLADTACTQALWEAVMGENPSNFKGPQRPVESVSWDDCQIFLKRINSLPELPGISLCLPTEAQWEYACRAGTVTPFSFGENITPEQVNYDGNYPYAGGSKGMYRNATVDVKSLPPNPWGLYEMHGNVREWCNDWYGSYESGSITDPQGPEKGEDRVLRGGSWYNDARYCRSAYRSWGDPGDGNGTVGFRLSRGQRAQGAERKGAFVTDSPRGALALSYIEVRAVRHDAEAGRGGLFGMGRKKKK